MIRQIKKCLYLVLLLCLGTGCESFLDEKPDKQQVVPTSHPDLQALLDNYSIINFGDPGVGEVSADDYFLTDADWASLTDEYRRLYIWESENVFPHGSNNDWFYAYRPVYTANTAIEISARIERDAGNQHQWDNVLGQALFIRAKSFLQVATIWAQAYEESTATTALGIPLRLSTDFDVLSERASLQQTYDRILSDLKEAAALLPETQLHPMRPSKAAAHALLARTYLYMRRYAEVETYTDLALAKHNALLNFNLLEPSTAFPIAPDNKEVLVRSISLSPAAVNISRAKVIPSLYASYEADDLRKLVYFRDNGNGSYGFKGSYEGSASLFSGISTNELYLMRAEARAMQGKIELALEDLNTLLETRWRAGTFVPLTATDKEAAVALIREERRKELLMRGLRWMDIKRYNLEGANISLSRSVDGQSYTLAPNDLRFALPIPEDVIELSGMKQNPR